MFDFSFNFDSNDVHTIHPYPAKFPPSVPHQLLQKLSKPGDVVLDPFCGSGTTLAEGLSFDCNVIGNDINFIALLISKVKTSNYSENDFMQCELYIKQIQDNYKVKKNIISKTEFKGIEHWFQDNVRYELDLIKEIIITIKDKKQKELLELVFSTIILDVSNQESDTRYASIDKNIQDDATIELFIKKYYLVKGKVSKFNYNENLTTIILNEDARQLKSIKDNSVDIIITSPPYANTYDYYLYHKQRMNWLDFDFNTSKNMEIGSRNEYSSKKRPIETWVRDIKGFIVAMQRVIRPNGYICIVIGDSVVNKIFFDALDAIKQIASDLNLEFVFSTSAPLSKNSRKFNHKFRTEHDKKEHIIILRKKVVDIMVKKSCDSF
ncbi:MAG: hypothetical protein IE880_04530 [Epsilonproteobacteria bacterium]|nr:hypothetical protein [Campylobacterota bacterium]